MPRRSPVPRKPDPPPYPFEWDPAKDHYNQWKHGVSFLEASTTFDDPNSLTRYDKKNSDDAGEDRWVLIGRSLQKRVLVVAHSDRGVKIRVISARDAETAERKQYEAAEEADEDD
jgi:uncharacterized protein